MQTTKTKAWLAMVVMVTVLGLLLNGTVWAAPEPGDGLRAPGALPQADDDLLISRAEGVMRGQVAAAYNDDLDEYLVVWADGRDVSNVDIYGQRFSASSGLPVGGNLVIRDEDHWLQYPDVAYDTVNGRYLVVWQDDHEDDIEGQMLNGDGTLYGSALNISDGTSATAPSFPAVAFQGPAGVYLVVFRQGLNGDYDVIGKVMTAAGVIDSTNYTVATAAGNQMDPDVSADPGSGGDFLIVWEDGSGGVSSIWGCTMSAATRFLMAAFEFGTTTTPRTNPALAFSPDAGTAGEWLVVFQRDVDGDQQIAGRRVAADGAITGGGFGISSDAGNQKDPRISYSDSEQRFLVVWEDERNGSTNPDIYARAVDNAGTPPDQAFAVREAPGQQIDPEVVMSSSGSMGLAIYRAETDDIEARQVTASGEVSRSVVVSAPLGQQYAAAVAYNSQDEEWLVVWRDTRAGNSDIYGQRLDRMGGFLGRSFAISAAAAGQFAPALTYNLDTNQYLVVWEDRRTDADIYGQRVNGDGSLEGAEIVVADSGSTARSRPQATFNPITGEFLVVYVYKAAVDNNDVRATRVSPAGLPVGTEIVVAQTAADEDYADVACRTLEPGGGGYLVIWQESSGTVVDLKGKRLDRNGALIGALDVSTEPSSQGRPRLAYNPDDDRYLVTWSDDRSLDTQGRDLYGRQVGGTGQLYPELAISTAAGNQTHPDVAYGQGINSYVVVWEDSRADDNTPDIYGQQVSGTGSLVGTTAGVNDQVSVGIANGQEAPAVAWSDAGEGLAAWEDNRAALESGSVYRIYGQPLFAEADTGPDYLYTFLPLIVHD